MTKSLKVAPALAAAFALTVGASLLVSAVAAPNNDAGKVIDTADLDVKEQAKLDQLLKGREPGRTVGCIDQIRVREMTPISEDILVYRMRGGRIFVNQPANGCGPVKRHALVTSKPSRRICAGDIAEVRDLFIGATLGSCSFSEFVEYEKTETSTD